VGSVALTLASGGPGSRSLGKSSSTNTRRLSSIGTGRKYSSLEMSVKLESTTYQASMFSWADSPAKTSVSLGDVLALLESAAASSMSSRGLSASLSQLGLSSKTSPVSLVQEEDGTWVPSSGRYQNSGMGGRTGYWTLSSSEFPSAAAVCSLSDILEETADVPQKFYLSAKACAGILRRAEHRGKKLPEPLVAALRAVAGGTTTSTPVEPS